MWPKNCNSYAYMSALSLSVSVQAGVAADPPKIEACISVSCLFAKNSRPGVWDSGPPCKLRHAGLPQLTHGKISHLSGCVNNILFMCVCACLIINSILATASISSHLPFRFSHICISPLVPLCRPPSPRGTTGCWVVRLQNPLRWDGWQLMSLSGISRGQKDR